MSDSSSRLNMVIAEMTARMRRMEITLSEREHALLRLRNQLAETGAANTADPVEPPAADARNDELQEQVDTTTRELDSERHDHLQALEDLRNTQERLLQAQKMEAIGQLAAGVAHEINTPIQYVSDNVTFLKRAFDLLLGLIESALPVIEASRQNGVSTELLDNFDAALKKAKLGYIKTQIPGALEQTIDGLQRVIVIVSAMKQLSHTSTADREPVVLADLIRAAVTIARNEWKYVADLELDVDEPMPAAMCYSHEISQTVLNLIINAAHAIADKIARDGGQKGRIDISLHRVDDWAELRISDTGCGIPEDIRTRVFDPFFTTKAVGKGTGQGLALAHSAIVDKHQGEITFESEVGIGTTFVVRLPLPPAGSNG